MNIKNNEVYCFKLNSGEEVVTKVIDVTENEILIHDPVSVAPGPQGMGLIPSLFTADPKAETRLNKNSVSLYALADAAIKSKYIEATTGIVVPEKKLILG